MTLATLTEPASILGWDTEFWGFRVAQLSTHRLTQSTVSEVDAWCSANAIKCLYFLSDIDDPRTTQLAEDNRFRLVDVRLTFGTRLAAVEHAPALADKADVTVRASRVTDIPELRRLAAESYHDTRFYFDRGFPRDRCDLLYETWIEKSCNGWADVVLVAVVDEQPTGFISCHADASRSRGKIGLVGVNAAVRGIGIGGALVTSALGWFATHNISEVEVVTQGRNRAAQRIYEREGFRLDSVQLWYHKWYAGQAASGH